MRKYLAKRLRGIAASRSYRVPPGERVYAIGDIHGCDVQLAQLLGLIQQDARGRESTVRLVFLGDYVDRGPASAAVLERLVGGGLPGETATFLMGNHEEVMLECLDGNTDSYAGWLKYGGLETLASYGVERPALFAKDFDLGACLRAVVPPEHVAFLRACEDLSMIGDYLFVHAGIRPGVALEQQASADLRWIRGDFLDDDSRRPFKVVHGHSIVRQVDHRPNRIAIDTGCFATGVMSALVLEDDRVDVLATGETG